MKRSHVAWGVTALALLAIALPFHSPAHAASGTTTLSGTLVSLSTSTRTLAIRRDDGTQTLLRITAGSALSRNGATVGIAALALRDRVTVRFDRASSTVLDLRASGPAVATVRGVLASVDLTRRTLSVVTTTGPRSFQTGPATILARNGRAASLQDLSRGDAVLVHARPAVGGAPALAKDVQSEGPEEDEIAGTISAINGQDVTITPAHGSPLSVHVDASTKISLCNGGCQTAALADLASGMRAEAEYDPVTLIANRLVARDAGNQDQARVRGMLTAVDATAGTLSITPEHGSAVDLKTDAKTRISLNEAPATLADLHTGNAAAAAYDATTMVASSLAARSDSAPHLRQIEGRVTAVGTGTLTITPEHGADVTLKTDSTTKFFKHGAVIALADVHVGDHAHGAYDSTTMIAAVIIVQSSNPVPQLSHVEGTVSAASASSITVTPHSGTAVTLTIDATTHIDIHGHSGTAADIHTGDRVAARYDATTMLAKQIEDAGGSNGHH